MSGSPGSGGSNPRKFSEKIALHNQKQAEETRAFEQLMTDLTVSRVQFQKIQQLRLTQTRAPYYGGSLPNVNQISNAGTDAQAGFPQGLDSVRGTRHHGLVERVQRERNRLSSPHRRPLDKHRQTEAPPYGPVYLSPPPDNNWRREQPVWTEDKRPGYRLLSQLNRTNSDSALHTSVMTPPTHDPFGQSMGRGPPLRNVSLNEAEIDGSGDVFTFPPVGDDSLVGLSKPLPKQVWEAKKVQSLASRPKSCEVPGINVFPSPDQVSGSGPGFAQFQGCLNSGGSLPDLSILKFPSPLHTPLDPPEDPTYPNISGGSSTGNLPAAMMHLGIGNSQGLSSSLSNPSIYSSVRLSSLPGAPQGGLNSSPRRRPTPISPLTLSPGAEMRRSKQLSPTMSPSLSPITQGVPLDTSNMPMEPPPPYPLYQQSQHAVGQGQQRPQQQQQHSPLHNLQLDFNSIPQHNMAVYNEQPFSQRQKQALSYQMDQFSLLESALNSASGSCLDPTSSYCPSQQAVLGGISNHGNAQDSFQMRPNMLFSSCGGMGGAGVGVPNIILTDDSIPNLSKDISNALSAVPECFGSDGGFPLEDELHIEPLSLDGLSMLSDPDLVLPDPSVEDSFRSDRL